MQVGDFFAALYERMENHGFTVYGPKKGPFLSARIDERWEDSVKGEKDIYFRLCPMDKPPVKGRGKQDESVALCFTWMDIDCGVHKNGKNYFPNREEAIKWVKSLLPWTAIVGSGTGLHVYCVLEDPFYITDKDSFKRAYELSARFQQWAREQCPYEMDSTHDLARVLRVPGTIHSGTGKPVEVLELREFTVPMDVLETMPVREKISSPLCSPSQDEMGFVLDTDRELPTQIIMNLVAINPKFSETWSGQRAPGDPSPSGWRLSMISFLMQAGLDRQDVADITLRFLIDQRGFSPDQLKLDRPDIWAAEMTKCMVEDLNNDALEDLVRTAPQEQKLGVIAALMEFPSPSALRGVSRFLVMNSDEEASAGVFQLHLRTMDGNVVKVDLPDIMSRSSARKTIFARTGIALPSYMGHAAAQANKKWEQAIQAAWHIADVMDPVQSEAAELLMIALKGQVNNELATSLEEARATGNPFKDDGAYVVPTAALNARARSMFPELRSNREMHAAVRELNVVGVKKVSQMYKGVRMACLLVPAELVEDNDE